MIHGGGAAKEYDKSGHASRDTPIKRPLGSKNGEGRDMGSNGQLFTRCASINMDKKAGDAWPRSEDKDYNQ